MQTILTCGFDGDTIIATPNREIGFTPGHSIFINDPESGVDIHRSWPTDPEESEAAFAELKNLDKMMQEFIKKYSKGLPPDYCCDWA